MRIATGGVRTGNDRSRKNLRVISRPVRRLVVGSESSAASGRGSEVSEWPQSKFPASAVRQRRNFGHRNRVIRNTPAQRSRRTDCHSQCAHWLRNDMFFCKGCGEESPRHGFAVPAPFRQGGREDEGTDCHSQCAHWLRNDMSFCKGCGEKIPQAQLRRACPL